MLYERWQQTVDQYRNELALRDLATGQQWTFAQLAGAEALAAPTPANPAGLACPQGNRASFIISLLEAWRLGKVVCPLEPAQAPPPVPPPPSGIVHLKFTSATTQNARLVAFTAEQLIADVEQIIRTMGLRPDQPNLGVISLAHSYGFSNLVLPLLLHGVPLFLLDSPLPESLRQAALLGPQFTLAAVPALWRAWHEASAVPENVRLAISAGAPLPLPLEQDCFNHSGLKIHNFYGATECGGIAYDTSDQPRPDATWIGAPLEKVSLAVDPAGCLEVRSAAVGSTYWPEAQPNLEHGCYRTSDLAEIRAGQVYLRGRAGDLINVAGRKISPELVERELLLHDQVRDCLVFGVPSREPGRSEIVVACVVASPAIGPEILRQFLLERLPAWQVPREWKFVDSLSPNERGKLSRAEWRRRLGYQPSFPSPFPLPSEGRGCPEDG